MLEGKADEDGRLQLQIPWIQESIVYLERFLRRVRDSVEETGSLMD